MTANVYLEWTLWGLIFASVAGIIVGDAVLALDKTTCRTGHRELVVLLVFIGVGSAAGVVNAVTA